MATINYERITRKFFYYCEWYASLDETERSAFIGTWVRERMELLIEAIHDDLKATANPLRAGTSTIGIP
jgi:hypothetical protein